MFRILILCNSQHAHYLCGKCNSKIINSTRSGFVKERWTRRVEAIDVAWDHWLATNKVSSNYCVLLFSSFSCPFFRLLLKSLYRYISLDSCLKNCIYSSAISSMRILDIAIFPRFLPVWRLKSSPRFFFFRFQCSSPSSSSYAFLGGLPSLSSFAVF